MTSSPYRAVWIATAPRTGSMWAYYVARQLLMAGGYSVILPPQGLAEGQWPALSLKLAADNRPNVIFCAKVHLRLALTIPDWRFILTYRDVRDSVLSYMRFMHASFEQGLQAAQSMMDITDHYFQAPDSAVLKLSYGEITESPIGIARRIADFLHIPCSDAQAGEIARRVTRDRVATLVAKYDASVRSRVAEKDVAQYVHARNLDGSLRLVEPTTLFQSGHITSARDGEWREVFTSEQQARLSDLAATWLRRYGFAVE